MVRTEPRTFVCQYIRTLISISVYLSLCALFNLYGWFLCSTFNAAAAVVFSLFLLFSMFYLHTPFFSLVFFKMCTNGCVENVRKYSMDIICDGKCRRRRRRRQKKKNVVGLIYRLCCSWHVSHYIISGQ